MYQNLLSVPAGGNTPEPDAAESCEFSDPKTYICKLKAGPEVLERRPADVRGRQVLARPDGRDRGPDRPVHAARLARQRRGDRSDDRDDEAQARPTRTWPFVLTHNVAAIVPDEIYPKDAKQPDDKAIGSGPYTLEKYTPNQQAVFKKNPEYNGANKGQTQNFIVQYFEQPSALKLAVENGEVDVAYRSLSPTDLEDLRNNGAEQGRQRRRRRGHRDPLHRLQRREEAGRRARRSARRSPRCIDRDAIARDLQGHDEAAVLDGPGRVPGRQGVLQGRLRRPGSGEGEGDPRRGRRLDPGRARRLVHADALRPGRGRPVERDQAPARRAAGSSR